MAWLRLEAVKRGPHRAGRALFTLLSRSGGAVRGVAAAIRGASRFLTLDIRTVYVCSVAARGAVTQRAAPFAGIY